MNLLKFIVSFYSLLLIVEFFLWQNEIISLSEKYVRALSRENTDIVDGPYAGRFTAYGMYRLLRTTMTLKLCIVFSMVICLRPRRPVV